MASFRSLHMPFVPALALTLVVVLASASASWAEVYRWKDSNGKVHFSDQTISTDPQVVQEVVVPAPNLAKSFTSMPKQITDDAALATAGNEDPNQPNDSVPAGTSQNPTKGGGVAASSKASCRAKVAAYKASRACFKACSQVLRGGTVNTAGCEYCEEQPMPQCWSRN